MSKYFSCKSLLVFSSWELHEFRFLLHNCEVYFSFWRVGLLFLSTFILAGPSIWDILPCCLRAFSYRSFRSLCRCPHPAGTPTLLILLQGICRPPGTMVCSSLFIVSLQNSESRRARTLFYSFYAVNSVPRTSGTWKSFSKCLSDESEKD